MSITEKIQLAISLIPTEVVDLLSEAYNENSELEDSEEIEFLEETIRFINDNQN